MDSLGLITPGVFEIGGRLKRDWLTEDIERRRRRDIEDESYQGKLKADQESMQLQYSAMNEELTRLINERDEQIDTNRRINIRLQEDTNRLAEDKKYLSDKVVAESLILSQQKTEVNEITKRRETEQVRLEKDREEARKSRGKRDQYELEIADQSRKIVQMMKEREEWEEGNEAARMNFETERMELHAARKEMREEMADMENKKRELTDSFMAYKIGMEEDQKSRAASTPRTFQRPITDQGEREMNRRVTIGQTETREITPRPTDLRTDHSFASLNPFADDTIGKNYTMAPPAPVYNITYQYGARENDSSNSDKRKGVTSPRNDTNVIDPQHTNDQRGSVPKGNHPRPGTGGDSVKKLTKRASMSPGMTALYDADPCIQSMGIDCCSRKEEDATEVMDWSRRQSDRLVWSENAARKPVTETPKFDGLDWKQSYQDFCDDNCFHGWDKEATLGPLVKWLNAGPGRIAVDDWRTIYGDMGNYDQLVRSATYLFGTLAATDPWQDFQVRTQKPKETAKLFGLELQRLLQKARPTWRRDDEYFLDELFTHFIRGLRDPAHSKLVQKEWGRGTSMVDLFIAIDQFDKKRRLLTGFVPQNRVNSVQADNESDGSDEERIAGMKAEKKKKKPWNKNKNVQKEELKLLEDATKVLQKEPVNEMPMTDQSKMLEEMMKQMKELMEGRRRPRTDRSTVKCFRCQEMGHYASSCTAEKPVWRGERTEEKPEN